MANATLITGNSEMTKLMCANGVSVHSNACLKIDLGCTGAMAFRDMMTITLHITDGIAMIARLTILHVMDTTKPAIVPIAIETSRAISG